MAAAEGDDKMVKLLLSKGENPNKQNKDGNTALHYAVAGNYNLCVDVLIAYGINENIENNEGLTAWELSTN
jgi:ankyrin repeat protein